MSRSRRIEYSIAALVIVILFVWVQMAMRQSLTRRLAEAARNGHLVGAQTLVARGANVNGLDKEGDSVLMAAVRFNQPDIVQFLENNGAKADAKTELMAAALMGRPAVAEKLLDGGLSANTKDRDGDTALAYAAQWGHVEVVKILLAHGADVNNRNVRRENPLYWTAHCREPGKRQQIFQMLRQAGAQDYGKRGY